MTKTINALTAVTSAASGDFLPLWRAANGDTRKITKANLMGGVMTGGGTIATGGFTLTVPATGIAALTNVAQTFSAVPTFGAGISFGGSTFGDYVGGTFVPQIWDAATGGNQATVTTPLATYTRIGNRVFVDISLLFIGTSGMTGANTVHIRNLPFTRAGTANDRSTGTCHAVSSPFTSGYLNALIAGTTNYLTIRKTVSGGVATNLTVAELTSGSAQLMITISYQVL
jgi:hypothetical protein